LDNLKGAFLMVLAMAGFAIEDMFIKLVSDTLPSGQILIMTGIGGGLVYGALAIFRREAPVTPAMLWGPSGLRALFEGLAGTAFVTALALVPLSLVTTVMQTNPLLVTLGAAVFFAEPVGVRRWSAICVGLFGVLIVLRPFGSGFEPATLFAVAGVLAMSARDLATRRVQSSISTVQLSTLGFLTIIPGGILSLAVNGDAMVMPDARAWVLSAATIGIGVPALFCIIAAMRVGEISFVAPFRYSRIVFGLFVGLTVFAERIDGYTLLGAAVIVASGLYTFFREAQLRRRASLSPNPAL